MLRLPLTRCPTMFLTASMVLKRVSLERPDRTPVIAAWRNAELNALAVAFRVMLRGFATSGNALGRKAFP
jgi:hypothetical protein